MSFFGEDSLRGRLLIWIGVLLLLILSGFGITAYQLNRREQMAALDERLTRWIASLVRDVRGPGGTGSAGNPPPGFRPPPREESRLSRNQEETWGESQISPSRVERSRESREPQSPPWRDPGRPRRINLSSENRDLFASSEPSAPYFQIWSREGNLLGASGFLPQGWDRPMSSGASAGVMSFTRQGYREAFYVTERGDHVLVGILQAPQMEGARQFGVWLVVAGIFVLAIGVGGASWLVTRAIKPVEEIAAAATRISQGTLNERIDATGMPRELARLAEVLNRSFSALAHTLEDQKRFTADASHELRTPLAVMITEAQSTLARERSLGDYR
ncbi:MAG TPA: HAMP domain-containing protein, partial [Opitutaceae bacterium]|nr:HAMP domain-containing protein [Opitutaceae bacterium]